MDPAGEHEAIAGWLARPEAYPDRPERVEQIETHISCVFLAGSHAYKLKKPVNYGFLDFSTFQARELACRDEVRLNRRLAARRCGARPRFSAPAFELAIRIARGARAGWSHCRGTWRPAAGAYLSGQSHRDL